MFKVSEEVKNAQLSKNKEQATTQFTLNKYDSAADIASKKTPNGEGNMETAHFHKHDSQPRLDGVTSAQEHRQDILSKKGAQVFTGNFGSKEASGNIDIQ
jgi:hypothetical protein